MSQSHSVIDGPWTPLGTEALELGEGARVVDGAAWFVDLLTGRLFRKHLDDDSEPSLQWSATTPVGAAAPTSNGHTIAAVDDGVALIRAGASPQWLARPGRLTQRPVRVNDAAADPNGRFWFGTMAWDNTPDAGCLYRVDPDGSVVQVLDKLTIPNGPAFTADGSTMYLADTARSTIFRFNVNPRSGAIEDSETFVTSDGSPDGMTVDAAGHLWVAMWGTSCLRRYSPTGELTDTIAVPATQPTSVAITDVSPYRVIVTSATYGMTAPGPGEGIPVVAPCAVAGLPVARFDDRLL
jgi:sugar lactone lactonase YvrE